MANLTSFLFHFPLEVISGSHFKQLIHALWSWELCEDCRNERRCTNDNCPGQRLQRLTRFLQYYKTVAASYGCEQKELAIEKHEEIFAIIERLKASPDVARSQILNELQAQGSSGRSASAASVARAVDLAAQALIMVSCSPELQYSEVLEQGILPAPWNDNDTLAQFVDNAFPQTDHPGLNEQKPDSKHEFKRALTAKKLRKHLGMKLKATDDLRNHLKLDTKTGTLLIFHHTAVLKEHLRLTKDAPRNMSTADCLKL